MSMQAGKLTRQITIERRVTEQDDIGQPVDSWSTVCIVWADIKFISGLEAVRADSLTSAAKCSVRIRHRTGITPDMRIVCGTLTMNILAVLPDAARREFVALACEVLS